MDFSKLNAAISRAAALRLFVLLGSLPVVTGAPFRQPRGSKSVIGLDKCTASSPDHFKVITAKTNAKVTFQSPADLLSDGNSDGCLMMYRDTSLRAANTPEAHKSLFATFDFCDKTHIKIITVGRGFVCLFCFVFF